MARPTNLIAVLFGSLAASAALVACGGPVTGPAAGPAGGPTTFSEPPAPPPPEWVVDAGGVGSASADAVGTFGDDSVLLTGSYDADIVLGRGTPNETTLPGTGNPCAFVSRFEADGGLRWARAVRGTDYVSVHGAKVLADGSIAVVGFFDGTASFDNGLGLVGPLGAMDVVAPGSEAGFVARYLGDGTLAWVRVLGGPAGYAEALTTVAVGDGSIGVGGLFSGPLTLGAGEPNEAVLASLYLEAFVARYAADGSLLWARSTMTMPGGYATAWAIGATQDAGLVVAGELNGTTRFDAFSPNTTEVASEPDNDDVWVARYGANGDLVWVRRIGGAQEDEVYSLGVAPQDDSIRVAGYFRDATTVDPDGLTPVSLVGNGALDAYLVSFGADGSPRWGRAIGGAEDDFAVSVAVLWDGSAVVTGGIHGPVDFDGAGPSLPVALNETVSTGFDVFVARYGDVGDLYWARVGGGTADDYGLAVSVDEANGTLLLGGSFSGAATMPMPLTASGAMDGFLARLGLAGAP